jgi:ribosomal protein S28E/S33
MLLAFVWEVMTIRNTPFYHVHDRTGSTGNVTQIHVDFMDDESGGAAGHSIVM